MFSGRRRTMRISLRRFDERDLPSLERWRDEIDSDRYMEKLSPVNFDGSGFEGWGLDYVWYAIEVDGSTVGGIWFDLKRNDRSIGVMGIVIGRTESLGRGIGRRAIAKAIPAARRVLGFDTVRLHVRRTNPRAISCYLGCGFVVTGEGSKLLEDRGKVPFYRMEMYLESGVPVMPAPGGLAAMRASGAGQAGRRSEAGGQRRTG